jgi:hypothetical protein
MFEGLIGISGAVFWVIKEDAKSGMAEEYDVDFGETKDGGGKEGGMGKSQR